MKLANYFICWRLTRMFERSSSSSDSWLRCMRWTTTRRPRYCRSSPTSRWRLPTSNPAWPSLTSWWRHSLTRSRPARFAPSLWRAKASKISRPRPGWPPSAWLTAWTKWSVGSFFKSFYMFTILGIRILDITRKNMFRDFTFSLTLAISLGPKFETCWTAAVVTQHNPRTSAKRLWVSILLDA